MNNPVWFSQYPVPLLDPSAARLVAYLDSVQARLASHKGMISLRELQFATGEELHPLFGQTLLPSMLRPSGGTFKGEL